MAYSDGQNAKNEWYTGPTEAPPHVPENGFPRDAWHCDNCQALEYNVQPGTNRPVPGAPMPHFISAKFQRVCSLCYDLYNNARFSLDYWQTAQREWRDREEKRKKDIDGLSGKRDYFTGL